jgi:AcrR family transcriptional regulator
MSRQPSRQRLSRDALTAVALLLVDESGYDALTLSAVAEQLQVGPSALYTHCGGLDGLRHVTAVAATNNLAGHVREAAIGTAGGDAVNSVAHAYRDFTLDHPGQFAATLRPPRANDDELVQADQAITDVFALVYIAMGLTPPESGLAARSIRSAVHGFLALEHNSGTTETGADDYQHLLDTMHHGISERYFADLEGPPSD